MTALQSKTAFLYREVRRALRSGSYLPGQRIDPATIAEEFHASLTPVRLALYRLVGEGLIADHARSGLYVPLPTEVALRDLYDWMQRLLAMACEIGIDASDAVAGNEAAQPDPSPDDVAVMTWWLFDAIAKSADQRSLQQAIEQANDRLAPVRRVGLHMIDDAGDELATLDAHWRNRDAPALQASLDAYHARRKAMVPRIVAALGDQGDFLH